MKIKRQILISLFMSSSFFTVNAQLNFKLSDGSNAKDFQYYNEGMVVLGSKTLALTDNQIGLGSNNDFYINNYAAGNGNVWIGKSTIGTTTVMNNFVVSSGIYVGHKKLWIEDNQIGLQSNNDFYINNYSLGNGNVWIGKSGAGIITAMNKLNIIGNVGIGTSTPDSRFKLDVEGTIRATEIKVCLQGGCDFVFNKDYKLMSLNELEKFVLVKQHLPEIASEKEMIENGLNMKEFQMKLLQKVEELTLYVIEQNKQIQKQNKQIQKQNQEIIKLKAIKKQK